MADAVNPDFLTDLFAEFGPVSVRRMFGGAGIFADGLMIGLVDKGAIYLKAGASDIAEFEGEGCGPFRYDTKDGKRTIKTYWRMPSRLYDDPQELAVWARRALAAARHGDRDGQYAAKRRPPQSKSGSKKIGRKKRR